MKTFFSISVLFVPQLVSAAGVSDIIETATEIVNSTLIPLAFALCLLYFFWGVAKYIREGAGSDKAAEEGRKIMVWGVVALFIVSSIWGIISFIQNELSIPSDVQIIKKS